MAQVVKGARQAAGASLRGRTTRKLARSKHDRAAVRVPGGGTRRPRAGRQDKVIGTGAKTSAVNGKVVRHGSACTPAGRKLLKRSKKLKVTVKGAFAASRDGAQTTRASSTVTLKR